MNIFKPYTKGEYKPYLSALVELGLLNTNESYWNPTPSTNSTLPTTTSLQYPTDKADKPDNGGYCKKYQVTDKALDLLNSSNVEYLKKLHTDKSTRRRNQKNISQRKVASKTYGEYVLNYIHDGLVNFEYDYGKAMAMVTGSNWSNETQQAAGQSLITFTEKTFAELQPNEADGRVFNEFVAMKSDLRKVFSYKSLVHKATIDIRACHPTFFSSYVLSLYNNSLQPLPTSIPPTLLQYPTDKADKGYGVKEKDLLTEHKRWVELFTNPNINPREVIAEDCGYNKDICKQALNETINGSQTWKILIKWIESKFPVLFKVWSQTDKKKTGPTISKDYETVLMLDPQLFRYAEEMGIKIAYEYDGVSVFGGEDEKGLMDKINFLMNFISWSSKTKFGVPVVFKVKTNN